MTINEAKQEILRLNDLNKQYSYLIKQRDIHNKELEKSLRLPLRLWKSTQTL